MPGAQLLNGLVESAANKALHWASNSEQVLAPLVGKTCIIHLQEPDHVLCFRFSLDRIDVLADEAQQYKTMPEDLSDDQCWVSVSLFALDKLKQNNQMTKLIKSGQLDFAGDLAILQSVSSLFDKIDLDFEEVLSLYVGDPAAYQMSKTGKQILSQTSKQLKLLGQTLSDAALDEKPIGVREIMLINFSDEVNILRTDTERLEARLTNLEARLAQEKSKGRQS